MVFSYGNFVLCHKLITQRSMQGRVKTDSCSCDLKCNLGARPSPPVTAPVTSTLRALRRPFPEPPSERASLSSTPV